MKINSDMKWIVILTILCLGEPDLIDSLITLIQAWSVAIE